MDEIEIFYRGMEEVACGGKLANYEMYVVQYVT